MAALDFADLSGMRAWAHEYMSLRDPDLVIGDDYLRRWWVIPRNPYRNIYLHYILHSDSDVALHDHPWENESVIIDGSYIEHTPEGQFVRQAGETILRPATALHRLEIPEGGQPVISLFLSGPKVRDWGFACPEGWRPWWEMMSPEGYGKLNRGCGE